MKIESKITQILREEAAQWEVYVGNVGRVYTGTNGNKAKADFEHYSLMSTKGEGRVAGEPVTLMMNGEIVDEHEGRGQDEAIESVTVTEVDSGVEREDTPVKIALSGLAGGFRSTLKADEELLRRLADSIGHYSAADNLYHDTDANVRETMKDVKRFIVSHENWRKTVSEYLSKHGW